MTGITALVFFAMLMQRRFEVRCLFLSDIYVSSEKGMNVISFYLNEASEQH